MLGVLGVEGDGVVVDVHLPLDWLEILAAVFRHLDTDIDHVDAIELMRVGKDLAVVLGIHDLQIAHALPRLAEVRGAKKAALLARRRDVRVGDVGLLRGHGQRNAAQVDFWNALGRFVTSGRVERFVDSGIRRRRWDADAAPPLIRRSQENVRCGSRRSP